MAQITVPKPSRKGAPPKPTETVQNLAKPPAGNNVPFQVRIKPETKTAFQVYASGHQIRDGLLFEQVWEYFQQHHG
jgi:hypothetical protein